MATVGLPLTGAGDATAKVATDLIGDENYQRMKLTDGLEGSTVMVRAMETTPASTDAGLVVRNIPSSGLVQLVAGTVDLGSAGSTKLLGQVTVANPSTSVDLGSGGSTKVVGLVTLTNPASTVTDLGSGGSTKVVGLVTLTNPASTAVDLGSGGSTKLVGQITVANPTTAVTLSSGTVLGASTAMTGLISSGTQTIGTVQLSSAGTTGSIGSVALLGGSSANMLGSVALAAGSSDNEIGGVNLTSGSTAFLAGAFVLGNGSTVSVAGSVALLAGSSANNVGQVTQGPGSSANHWFVNSLPFSSANTARTTVNSTVDVSIVAANANRKALIIANASTAQRVGLGFSTGAVTTALANVNAFLEPASIISFGLQGGLPLFTGPIRGINISSTTVAGGVNVTEFT